MASVANAAATASGGAGDPALAVRACSAVADKDARLSCYDALARVLSGASSAASAVPAAPAASVAPPVAASVAPAGAVAPRPAIAPPESQLKPEQFGSETLSARKDRAASAGVDDAEPAPLDRITDTVTAVSYNPYGRFTVTLANGQVWQQSSGDSDKANFPTHGTVSVTIARGILGSYNLTIGDHPALFKVKRIK